MKVTFKEPAKVGDVVQMDPAKSRWGAVLVVVEETRSWGVIGYFLAPGAAGEGSPVTIKGTGAAYIRIKHEDYVRIGVAEWTLAPNAGFEDA
jgi:hypothetical protein